MKTHHDTATPALSVMDPRALAIRSVAYCRHPDQTDIESRITRQIFDAAGRQVASWDPRLWGTAPKPNLATTYGLSGQALLTDSVDAGWQLSLPDQAGSLRCSWDARGSECHRDYDDLQRTIVVTEQARGELPRVVERLSYADAGDAFAQHNQCGRLIRHDDPAGTRLIHDYGLAGAEQVESRRMLTDLDLPDWPSDPEHRDVFLEEQSYVTRYVFYPTGELQRQTDAMGNAQTFHHDVAGKLSAMWLHPAGADKQPKCQVGAIRYNAHEQIEHETAGNRVTTRAEYSPEDGRLLKLSAAVGEQTPLQNLQYVYDPAGNIVSLENKTQAVTYFNQQRIEPVSRYRYDSLYQLVEAKGWEVSQPSHGPALPDLLPTPLDPNQRRNYTQTFDYDAAGNLLNRHHSGAPGFSMFTSAYSNRSLAQRDDGSLPGEPQISQGFDRAGNQLELQRGQAMSWDLRNQLRRVTLVQRQDEPNDDEGYVYDRPGHRLRKTRLSQTSGQTLKSEVRYLPGLEIHCEKDGVERHVISVEAGRNQVRMLHWPDGAESDQLRYSLSDHLGSSTLELDDDAGILSQEHYYPFGGAACWAGKSAVAAKRKTIRYSGKERDATGLYYYGYRYYAPWLQRWINPDPMGTFDGLNLYCMVRNNPGTRQDANGLFSEGEDKQIINAFTSGRNAVARARYLLDSMPQEAEKIMKTYFGPRHSVVHESVILAWSQTEYILSQYAGLMMGNVQNKVIRASVRTIDTFADWDERDKKITVYDNFFDDDVTSRSQAAVLIHEVTHIRMDTHIGSRGAGSEDFFYLDEDDPAADSAEILNGTGLKVGDIEDAESMFNEVAKLKNYVVHYVETVDGNNAIEDAMLYGQDELMRLPDAVSIFNSDETLRAQLSAKNADSLAYAAMALGDRFDSIMASMK